MRGLSPATRDRFNRFVLPGLAFKAVVIGGGYATGREIAEFFLPAGPWGGLLGMALATVIWGIVAAATFHFAYRFAARDYRSFFRALLGRAWFLFEIVFVAFIVLILAVFGAAAGEIGAATFGLAPAVGTIALMVGIVACVAFGNDGVERLFLWVSILLYATYALFFVLVLTGIGDRIGAAFAASPPPAGAWFAGGLTYAAYNIVGAVTILPVTRHFRTRRDAPIAGALAAVLAMLPALLFFISMVAFLPGIALAVLPSDYVLARLGQPMFHMLFQIMIFAALLESGSGAIHAINERLAHAGAHFGGGAIVWNARTRALAAFAVLMPCMFVADRIGLVALIASGYRALAWAVLAVFVVPLLARMAMDVAGHASTTDRSAMPDTAPRGDHRAQVRDNHD